MEVLNYIFAGIFTVEAAIKLIAFGGAYFNNGWNVFDFIIVIGTFIGILLSNVTDVSVGPSTTVIRSFRIGRVFRLVKRYKELQTIFNTFIVAIPALANVGGLLFLFIYLYAILGVFIFSKVQHQASLDNHANFKNFGNALLLLIRISTGEAWNDIMFDCARERGITFQCVNDPSYEEIIANGGEPNGCGSQVSAFLYFISFMVIVSFIFLNLFIAIILEGFNKSS